MEPPATPRKPRRTKATPENPQENAPENAASTPKRRRTTKTEDSAKPKATRPSTTRKKAADSTAAGPASVPSADVPVTPLAAPAVPAASVAPHIREDEPDIFKPLPPQAPAAPKVVVPAPKTTPSASAQQGPDRYMTLLRTWTARNVEIVRKSFARTSDSVDTSSGTGVNNMAQRSTSSLDSSLDKLQKQLETSDSAVLIATLIFIVVCMVFTLLLSAAFR